MGNLITKHDTIKITSALEAPTVEGIVTFTDSVFDLEKQQMLSELLRNTEVDLDINPNTTKQNTKLTSLGINGVNYRLEDIGLVNLLGATLPCELSAAQLAELDKEIVFVLTSSGTFIKQDKTNESVLFNRIIAGDRAQSNYHILSYYTASVDLSTNEFSVVTTSIEYYTKSRIDSFLAGKQETLISGTNLKTINGISLLDEGDITVTPVEATEEQIRALFIDTNANE